MTSVDKRIIQLQLLQREYKEMEASLPAHSIPASMLIRLEELEDAIGAIKKDLESNPDDSSPS
jgi:hypothetical protein